MSLKEKCQNGKTQLKISSSTVKEPGESFQTVRDGVRSANHGSTGRVMPTATVDGGSLASSLSKGERRWQPLVQLCKA